MTAAAATDAAASAPPPAAAPAAGSGAAPASRAARLREWLDWRANPMLLKDLRIWMRMKKFLGTYFLVLLFSVVGAAFYTILARAEHFDGRAMWAILGGTLAIVAWGVVPYFVFERFHQELSNRATELVLLSALTPARLVFGKLASAWCASLLCAAAVTPMLVTAYLLGGVDLSMTLFSLSALVLGAVLMPMIQLYIATLGKRAQALRGLAILTLVWQVNQGIGAAVMLYGGTRRGALIEGEAWWFLLAVGVSTVLFVNFLFRLTVARLTSTHINRDAAPRLAFLAFLYGGALAFALAFWRFSVLNGLMPDAQAYSIVVGGFGVAMLLVLALGTIMLSDTCEDISRRLRGIWIGRRLRRLFLFPGVRRLTAFFLANAFLLFGLLAISGYLWSGSTFNDHRISPFLWAGAGIFAFTAVGLAAHIYIVMPLWRKKGVPAPAAATILVANLALGIVAAGVNILQHADLVGDNTHAVALGFSPPVVFAYGLSWRLARDGMPTCIVGAGFAAVMAVLLIKAVAGIARIPPPSAPSAPVPEDAAASTFGPVVAPSRPGLGDVFPASAPPPPSAPDGDL